MTTVAITGVGGLVGRRLVGRLDGTVDIVGIDVSTPDDLAAGSLRLRQADVRDPGLSAHFDGVDVVVHLAFQMDPIHDEQLMRSVNVEGTQNVFEAAVKAGVSQVVYLSSVVAYGAHPDNDFPLTEDSLLRPNPDFSYAEHKGEVEAWLWPWMEQHPDLATTVLRPAIILGPGVNNFMTRQMESPRPVIVRGHRPPWQFVHVDDVVSAIIHAIDERLTGAYNVCPEGWLSLDEMVAISGRRPAEVPEEVAFTVAERLWKAGVAEAPPGEVHYLMHPFVASPDKLLATGWRPQHSNRDAYVEMVEEHRPFITLGRVRARRSTVATASLAAAGLAALGGWAGVRAAQRRRRRS